MFVLGDNRAQLRHGDDAGEVAVLVHGVKRIVRAFDALLQELRQGHVLGHQHRIPVHDLAGLDGAQNADLAAMGDAVPGTLQVRAVDGILDHQMHQGGAADHAEHQWQDEGVLAAHFENDQNGGDRDAVDAAEHGAHAHQGEGGGVQVPAEQVIGREGEQVTVARAHEQGGGKHAAKATGFENQRHENEFQHQQHGDGFPGHAAGEDVVDGGVADAQNFFIKITGCAQGQAHGQHRQPARNATRLQFPEKLSQAFRIANVQKRQDAGAEAQDGVQVEQVVRPDGDIFKNEGGLVAEENARNGAGGDRSQDQRGKGRGLEVIQQDDFQGKEDAAEGCIEHGGNGGAGAGGGKHAAPGFGKAEQPADATGHATAQLRCRALGADRAAGADADGRGQEVEQGGARRDVTAAQGHGLDHFDHAAFARGLRCGVGHQALQQHADGRDHDHCRHAEKCQGAGDFPEEDVGEKIDGIVEKHRCQAGSSTDKN